MKNKIRKNDLIKTFEYIFTDENEQRAVYELLNRMNNEIQNIKLFFETNDSENIFESFDKLSHYEHDLKQKLINRTFFINGIFENI